MLNPSVKNLNLLLGLGQTGTEAGSAAMSAGKTTGRRFASVLDLLLQVGQDGKARAITNLIPDHTGAAPVTQDQIDTIQQKLTSRNMPAIVGVGVAKTESRSLIDGGLPVPDAGQATNDKTLDTKNLRDAGRLTNARTILMDARLRSAEMPSTVKDAEIGEGHTKTSAERTILNPQLAAMVEARVTPVDLVSGNYAVKDARIEGDRLILDVETLDKQQIKVTLPVEMIARLGEKLPIRPNLTSSIPGTRVPRIPLPTRTSSENARLNDLFSKLELKELRIAESDPGLKAVSRATTAQNPVEVKLIAVQSGEEVVLKQRLQKNQVRAELHQTSTRTTTVKPPTTANINTERQAPAVSRPGPVNSNPNGQARPGIVTGPVDPRVALQKETASLETLTSTRHDSGDMSSNIMGADRIAAAPPKADSTFSGRSVVQPVRYVMDEDLASRLKPHGKSVSINIEPEHLGHARLRLSVHNDVLTARLTVETPQAKAAVESSLDQLTDQLARAGIRVNQVEVSVHGGDIDGWRFEHGPMNDRLPNGGRRRISNEPAVEITDRDEVRPYRIPTYIRADQVNVFA